MSAEPFLRLISRLAENEVRYIVIGVWAANYYARTGAEVFTTQDRDLFLPPDPENLLRAWSSCRAEGFSLWSADEPLGEPLDRWLAERVVAQRALTSAVHDVGLVIDLSLVMAGFEFDSVWSGRRIFRVEEVDIPVARISHIVESKARAGRPKDRLFLATYEERLQQLIALDDSDTG
jgi:hypothetical protein